MQNGTWLRTTMATSEPIRPSPQERLIRHQELLIAELNHRARNSLHLISNLIQQSACTATCVDDFAQTVNARVKAMARAHDLITRKKWDPISFSKLFAIETAAFDIKAERVMIQGRDMGIHPEACTTLALVLHELVTNAIKYGAFASSRGRLLITLAQNTGGDLLIDWQEEAVAPLDPPTKEGFGSTIINGSIPYELGGTVKTSVTATGLHAQLMIPHRYLDDSYRQEPLQTASETCTQQTADMALSGTALLVEDSMLMAMGAERYLQNLGAEAILICQDATTALEAIAADHSIRFCLLDVNLDGEYSLEVAEALAARNIPFILATGYAHQDDSLKSFPDAPLITKPYGQQDIAAALQTATLLANNQQATA